MDKFESRHWQVRAMHRAFERMVEENRRTQQGAIQAATLVAAAQELVNEGDFTIKEVADRAGVAVQTFYRHFGSKDELVLAVIEENIADGSRSISEVTSDIKDPLGATAVVRFTVSGTRDSAGLQFPAARERVRLSETYAAEVEAALSPYRMLLIDAVSQAAAAGEAAPVDIERDADIILHLLLSYTHTVAAHAVSGDADEIADYVWGFCVGALQRAATGLSTASDEHTDA